MSALGPGEVDLPDRSPAEGLELELRHLPGVEYIGFHRQAASVVIEIGTDGTVQPDAITAEATTLAQGWLSSDVEVRVTTPPVGDGADAPLAEQMRVQLLATIGGSATGDEGIEIHLAHLGRRTVASTGEARLADVGEAALSALRHLGFVVPFVVDAVHPLSEELGAGVVVVLVDPSTGARRRGLASGRSPGEAVARAVLNGLNRFLQAPEGSPEHL